MTSKARIEMALKFTLGSLRTLAWRKVAARYKIKVLCNYSGDWSTVLTGIPAHSQYILPAMGVNHSERLQQLDLQVTKASADIWSQWHEKP